MARDGIGVNAVVLDARGMILLALRDRPRIWNLPGGGWEPGEALWDAAVREVREEVGVDVEVVRLTGVYDRSPDGGPVLVFLCRHVGGEARPTSEAVEVRWTSLGDLPADMNPYQRRRIADALAGRAEAVLVRQPGRPVRELYPD